MIKKGRLVNFFITPRHANFRSRSTTEKIHPGVVLSVDTESSPGSHKITPPAGSKRSLSLKRKVGSPVTH